MMQADGTCIWQEGRNRVLGHASEVIEAVGADKAMILGALIETVNKVAPGT
jgi:hypothetical protein